MEEKSSKIGLVNLKEIVSLITGGNSGIGLATTTELTKFGSHVIVTVRSQGKGGKTVKYIKKHVPDANVERMILGLSSLSCIKEFSQKFKEKKLPLHILINNRDSSTIASVG